MDIPFGTILEGILTIAVSIIGYVSHLRDKAAKLEAENMRKDFSTQIASVRKDLDSTDEDLAEYKKSATKEHKNLEDDYKEKIGRVEKTLCDLTTSLNDRLRDIKEEANNNNQQLNLQFSKINEKLAEINTAIAVINGKLMTKEDIKDIVKLEMVNQKQSNV